MWITYCLVSQVIFIRMLESFENPSSVPATIIPEADHAVYEHQDCSNKSGHNGDDKSRKIARIILFFETQRSHKIAYAISYIQLDN